MRWMRPWQFTKVPSFSTYAAVGSTQCAREAVRILVRSREHEETQLARQLLDRLFAEHLRQVVPEDPQGLDAPLQRFVDDLAASGAPGPVKPSSVAPSVVGRSCQP